MTATGINWNPQHHVRTAGPTRSTDGGVVIEPNMSAAAVSGQPHTGATPGPAGTSPTGAAGSHGLGGGGTVGFPRWPKADLVGFGDSGTWSAQSKGDGTFYVPQQVVAAFGRNQGWDVASHVRVLADVTGEGRGDLVGFGDAGVWVSPSTYE